jgi:hypothetical protein
MRQEKLVQFVCDQTFKAAQGSISQSLVGQEHAYTRLAKVKILISAHLLSTRCSFVLFFGGFLFLNFKSVNIIQFDWLVLLYLKNCLFCYSKVVRITFAPLTTTWVVRCAIAVNVFDESCMATINKVLFFVFSRTPGGV